MTYSALRNQIIEERPDIDTKALDRAFEFAKKAHEGQTRYSGEPYIIHPVGAARILLRLNPDLAALQACLLHDVTEDTDVTLEEIEAEFGAVVAQLVEGMEKLSVVKLRGEGVQGEKWKKMFLGMARDLRIVFIKLADRLHNMQTLQHVPLEKRERIAKESLLVHAAIASRLGIYKIKGEMEDLCFQYLYPEDYKNLKDQIADFEERSQESMAFATSQIEQLLQREGVRVSRVDGRMKYLWSIYQKMKRKDTEDLKDIYDLFAVRVILPDLENEGGEQVSHLYTTLGLIHSEYIPLQDRFKDYVAVPKPNGYRSLHTTVLGLGGDLYEEPTEIQIRTESMHREAEIGIATHWSYKMGKMQKVDRERSIALNLALKEVRALVGRVPDIEGPVVEWVERYQQMSLEDRKRVRNLLLEHGMDAEQLEDIQKGRSMGPLSMKPSMEKQLAWLRGLASEVKTDKEIDLFPNKIFVLTPQKDILELPRGATPLDFAYAIHSEVGHKTVFAKANGRIVPLDYELRNGDMVEIGTRGDSRPKRLWLSHVKTGEAKSKIKNWFNKQDRDLHVRDGRELLNKELKLLGKPILDEKLSLLKEYGGRSRTYQEREELLESLGLSSMTVSQMLKMLFGAEAVKFQEKPRESRPVDGLSAKVLVTGEEDLPVVLSACCKPKPPGAIIGYVTRGKSIRVHRQSCLELSGLEGERFVSVHWKD